MTILALVAIVVGLIVLMWSADRFIIGAQNISSLFNVPPIIVGVFMLGFGTSAPEMVVAAIATLDGAPGIAIGNVVGSNIANIGLVLGITAMIAPLTLSSKTFKRETMLVLLITIVALYLFSDYQLQFTDGIILILLFTFVLSIVYFTSGNEDMAAEQHENSEEVSLKTASFQLLSGLIVLLLSARLLVWGAVEVALFFGISEAIIGLTIVAIGTSLPELATSIAAVRKKHYDLSIGNILGSNLFNLLAVLPIPALLAAPAIEKELLDRDGLIMLGFTVLLIIFIGMNWPKLRISRWQGGVLLTLFCSYMGLLTFQSI